MKRIRFYKPTRLRLKWISQPNHWYAYTDSYKQASQYNLTNAPLIGMLPRCLRWLPVTLEEKTCKICGTVFWSGWTNHSDVCAKWSCFKQYSTNNVHADGKNTEEEKKCT